MEVYWQQDVVFHEDSPEIEKDNGREICAPPAASPANILKANPGQASHAVKRLKAAWEQDSSSTP